MLSQEKYNDLLEQVKALYHSRVATAVANQGNLVSSRADFRAYLHRQVGRSEARERSTTVTGLKKKGKGKLLFISSGSLVATAASAMLTVNFYYQSILSGYQPVTADQAVTIERPGYFYGSQTLRDQNFYTNSDSITTLQITRATLPAETSLKMSANTSLVVKHDTEKMLSTSQAFDGVYHYTFNKGSAFDRRIMLKGDKHIRVVGTELLIKAGTTKTQVYLKNGRADLYDGEQKVRKLKPKRLVIIRNDSIKQKKIKKKKLKKLFSALSKRPGPAKTELKKKKSPDKIKRGNSNKKKKKAKKTAGRSLEALKKLGPLVRLTTKDGKSYIGVYKGRGSKTEIITTSGKKVIDSKNIKVVKPYKS